MRTESATTMRTRGVLTFSLGDVWFGARVEETAGLAETEHLVRLPHQREPLAGVIAFRGGMIPTFDLASFLGIESGTSEGPRYALILTRGGDRFGVVIPKIPRLVHARDLREAEVSTGDPELSSAIDSVFESGETRIHCLNYWSIMDSIMPRGGEPREARP